MYSILVLLNQKPLDSRASHQISNLALFPLLISSTKIISFATITSAKRYRLNANPYFFCIPIMMGNPIAIPPIVLTLINLTPSKLPLNKKMYF